MLLAMQTEISEHTPQTFSKAADLDKSGFECVPQTYEQQQDHENVV